VASTFPDWLREKGLTYREAADLARMSPAEIGHIATESRVVSWDTAQRLDALNLPSEVKVWIARRQVRREREVLASIDRWKRWCKNDLPPEDE
jgi:plasmid maintenance system antidote protein VapI